MCRQIYTPPTQRDAKCVNTASCPEEALVWYKQKLRGFAWTPKGRLGLPILSQLCLCRVDESWKCEVRKLLRRGPKQRLICVVYGDERECWYMCDDKGIWWEGFGVKGVSRWEGVVIEKRYVWTCDVHSYYCEEEVAQLISFEQE